MANRNEAAAAADDVERWPVEIELTVTERLLLFNFVLPREGTVVTLRTLRALREEISIGEDEDREIGLSDAAGNMIWTPKKEKEKGLLPKPFAFGRKAWEIVADSLKQLEKKSKLPESCLELYEKFTAPPPFDTFNPQAPLTGDLGGPFKKENQQS